MKAINTIDEVTETTSAAMSKQKNVTLDIKTDFSKIKQAFYVLQVEKESPKIRRKAS